MNPSPRRPKFALLIAAVILWACGSPQLLPSPTQVPEPAAPTASPAAPPAASPAGSPAASPAGSPAAPAPSPGLTAPLLNTVVATVSDRLRVRSEPRVSDDSIKYEPLLPLGTPLYVVNGPVNGSGYEWYEVASVSLGLVAPGTCGADQGPCDGIYSGWVARAGRDGELWLAPGRADCPPAPTDVPVLARLPLGARLACFSRMPITVQARLVDCNCDLDGGGYQPAWFGGGSQPLLLVEPSETRAPADYEDWLIVRLDPAGRYPDVLPVGKVVEVTGVFDHPDGRSCLYSGAPVDTAGPPTPTSDCRFMFATTSLVAVRP